MKTAIEKIISDHAGRDVHAGEIVIVNVDLVMAQDGNAPLAVHFIKEKLKATKTFDPQKVVLVIDHCSPSPTEGASKLQQMMRGFSKEFGAVLYDAGEGISHVLLPEQGHVKPGMIILGSDSHTTTYGALNCLATGMGSTDISTAMVTGKAWMRVPETIKINLYGRLNKYISAKDLILHIIKQIGVEGATYKCLEFHGEGLNYLSMDERFTICNMAIEMGGKCAIMPIDTVAQTYIIERNISNYDPVVSDSDCIYESEVNINLEEVVSLVAIPHDLTRIEPITDISPKIDIAFIGTCTNGRIKDLEDAFYVLRGKKVNPCVRLVIIPGSKSIYLEALKRGFMQTFVEAGAIIGPPGCGPCVGTHLGIPGDNEVIISTANRNFKGRMGNRTSYIYLASPANVAASSILGRIGSAKEVLS